MIIQLDSAKEQNSVLQTKANDYDHSMLTMRKKLNKSEVKKYGDTFLVIIGLLIIVGTVICYLFYNLNSLNKRVSLVVVILFCNFGLSGWLDCCLCNIYVKKASGKY